MKLRLQALCGLAGFACLFLLGATPAPAQTVTTGSLTGAVVDAQGGVLPGATVTAVHTPTGTSYEAVTDASGRYSILNMRVGPYTVTATMSGFRKEEVPAVVVNLGEQRTVDLPQYGPTHCTLAGLACVDTSIRRQGMFRQLANLALMGDADYGSGCDFHDYVCASWTPPDGNPRGADLGCQASLACPDPAIEIGSGTASPHGPSPPTCAPAAADVAQ